MWIDDQLVMDYWQVSNPTVREATVHSDAAGQGKRIRIDYYDNGGYAKLDLTWVAPGKAEEFVPGTALKPRYGLKTSTTASESGGGARRSTRAAWRSSPRPRRPRPARPGSTSW
ncbi:PA14 domain-containing protein [Amycolatopsis sp. A133]|uniref:PA14 domain-containing protein n=1 Tax=Amycolatopsis sp. A133 TaxID=3064472 RepID=UPI0027EDA21F|nr:PA14 domain-containing protein [Amycolatopsis sp. A133]MDQ7809034.1 PA14 domain-containing protein [Amycolatopsis sp. A133]